MWLPAVTPFRHGSQHQALYEEISVMEKWAAKPAAHFRFLVKYIYIFFKKKKNMGAFNSLQNSNIFKISNKF